MALTDEQLQALADAARPLIEWLSANGNPHTKILVDNTGTEVLVGTARTNTHEFI